MFGNVGKGIVGGVSMVCTLKYLKDQKKEKKDMKKEIKTYKLENDYLRKKIDKLEETEYISDKEILKDNVKFMNNFDTLLDAMKGNMDVKDKEFKKVEKEVKRVNRAINKNRKKIDKMLEEFDLD